MQQITAVGTTAISIKTSCQKAVQFPQGSLPADTGHSAWYNPNHSLWAPPSSLQADEHLPQI
jgi:hypothetical protein